jgi:hypothetical protein
MDAVAHALEDRTPSEQYGVLGQRVWSAAALTPLSCDQDWTAEKPMTLAASIESGNEHVSLHLSDLVRKPSRYATAVLPASTLKRHPQRYGSRTVPTVAAANVSLDLDWRFRDRKSVIADLRQLESSANEIMGPTTVGVKTPTSSLAVCDASSMTVTHVVAPVIDSLAAPPNSEIVSSLATPTQLDLGQLENRGAVTVRAAWGIPRK